MPDPHQGLELELKDFVNPARVKDYETMHHRIFISSTILHRFLLKAEMKGNASQYRNPLPPGTKKRQRAKTPPEITVGVDKIIRIVISSVGPMSPYIHEVLS